MSKKPFFDHFKELNIRIFASLAIVLGFAIIVYANYSTIYNFLVQPLLNAGYSNADLVAFTIYEGFQVKISNTLLVSLVLSLPVLIVLIGNFIKPAINNLTNFGLYNLYIFIPIFILFWSICCISNIAYSY